MKRLALALLLASPAYAQTYEPLPLSPQIIGSPTTTTPLHLGDDNTIQVDLGFEFPYWGQTFTSAWVSSNGFISFGTSSNLCCNGAPIEQAPRNTIYGFWTDLISASNPYYRRDNGSFLVGWYGTNEFGTNIQETFELNLFSSGDIQFNFGSLGLQYHDATAGITGPNAGDNIQLFYGRNPSVIAGTSWSLIGAAPVAQVDCTITPQDPSCPPEMIAPVQIVTLPGIVTIQDAATADAIADAAEAAAQSIPEPEQEIETAQVETVTESITEQVADAIAAEQSATATAIAASTETAAPERLSPEQVAALAANGPSQDSQMAIAQDAPVFSIVAGPTAQFGGSVASGTFSMSPSASAGFSSAQTVEVVTATNSSSPSSIANTLEALNMSGSAMPSSSFSQGGEQQGGSMSNPDSEKLDAMASVPGFNAYAQVALQDRQDFYAVRDIYKNRRIRDANFEMYRMTQSNNAKWQEMVDVQYR